jgi:uncharacterized protein YbcI
MLVFFVKTMITIGQLEDNIAKKVTRFYLETLGHGPKETRVYIIDDMVIVRLKGKLLPIEEKLLEREDGVGIVKDIRKVLHETVTKNLSTIVHEVTDRQVISAHSDISTKTGEVFEAFILDKSYENRNKKSPIR